MGNPKVSIIISVFGQLQYTKRCLAQLEETLAGKLDYEVLIIDDASKDGTVDFLKDLGEGVSFNELPAQKEEDSTIMLWKRGVGNF